MKPFRPKAFSQIHAGAFLSLSILASATMCRLTMCEHFIKDTTQAFSIKIRLDSLPNYCRYLLICLASLI